MQHTIFIADLHLSAAQPALVTTLAKFAETITPQTTALYILGDLFSLWVGDDDQSPFNHEIIMLLKKIAQHAPVYLMPGNRDFLLGPKFAVASNCTLLSDPTKIDLYDRPTLLSHGDRLCANDIAMSIFRSISQNKLAKQCFLCVPLALRSKLAHMIQDYTIRKTKTKIARLLCISSQHLAHVVKRYQITQVIHGHIHRSEEETLTINNQTVRRISLSNWETTPNALIYYANGTYQINCLDLSTACIKASTK